MCAAAVAVGLVIVAGVAFWHGSKDAVYVAGFAAGVGVAITRPWEG